MPTINEVQKKIENLTNIKVSYTDIGNALGTGRANISLRAKNNSQVTVNELKKIGDKYNIDLIKQKLNNISQELSFDKINTNIVKIPYHPDVYLSAGYGTQIYSESAQFLSLDESLLKTEKGLKIKPEHCEIVRISGNSMEPEFRHGDRVIIDRNDTELSDGHIYAFRYEGQCYVKEINLLGKRIKCISLNKEYDPFYIEQGEQFTVFGRILPRIRL